jgi:hypothetical protein
VWFSPEAFRLLPQSVRITKARTVLGPGGSWWLKNRIEGVVETLLSHQVRVAGATGSGVRLQLDGPEVTTLDVDHVIAGTGFRIDVDRLGFLSEDLRGQIATLNKYPVLTRAGQTSVPGLYFAGAPAAVSLGPSERFIGGTHNSVRQLSTHGRSPGHPRAPGLRRARPRSAHRASVLRRLIVGQVDAAGLGELLGQQGPHRPVVHHPHRRVAERDHDL